MQQVLLGFYNFLVIVTCKLLEKNFLGNGPQSVCLALSFLCALRAPLGQTCGALSNLLLDEPL